MGKRIVVLGGAGLIGTHLCLRLLTEGNDVFCVDIRDAAGSRLLTESLDVDKFRYINHSITGSFTIKCDEIYNLTAPTRLRYDRALPVETLRINVLGAINTLEAGRAQQTRILYASSGDVYDSPYHEPISKEGVYYSPKYIFSEGKRAGEAFHRAYKDEYGIDTRIARIFNTYGTGANIEDQRVVMKMVVAALRNRDITIYGSGEQLRTFCWVGDMVDGLVKLMQTPQKEQSETIDLGGADEISIRELAEMTISITGSRSHIIHTTAHSNDSRRRIPDLAIAKRELGWSPSTSLQDGLKRVIDYTERELSRTAWNEMSWVEMNY